MVARLGIVVVLVVVVVGGRRRRRSEETTQGRERKGKGRALRRLPSLKEALHTPAEKLRQRSASAIAAAQRRLQSWLPSRDATCR